MSLSSPYFNGWDYKTTRPGEVKDALVCPVCDSRMDVDRNVDGPTSSVEAMSKGKHLHDVFRCPNAEEFWHRQAREIYRECEETVSGWLRHKLTVEAQEIVSQRRATILEPDRSPIEQVADRAAMPDVTQM